MLLQIFKTQSIRNIVHDDWSCLFATAVTVMVVATSEGLPLSATLTCGIFYEMPDAWIHHGSRTFCLLHNGLSQKKKKKKKLHWQNRHLTVNEMKPTESWIGKETTREYTS